MRLFYTDHFVLPLPDGHRFPMEKYYRLREYLKRTDWAQRCQFQVPGAATNEQLQLAHSEEYIDKVVSGTLEPIDVRRIGFPWSEGMVERSRRSVGATIDAARAALSEGIAVNLAGGTHHAQHDAGQGYCVFNDTAVAVRVLQKEKAIQRALVVDCDVHQGNGTAAIFAQDYSVFTFSMHAATNYPFRKHAADLDLPLPDGTGDVEYLDQLDTALTLALKSANADIVFYISGADPFEGDRLGKLKLTKQGLLARDRLVLTRCLDWSLPVAISMGGGYAPHVDDVVEIHANTVATAFQLYEQGRELQRAERR